MRYTGWSHYSYPVVEFNWLLKLQNFAELIKPELFKNYMFPLSNALLALYFSLLFTRKKLEIQDIFYHFISYIHMSLHGNGRTPR